MESKIRNSVYKSVFITPGEIVNGSNDKYFSLENFTFVQDAKENKIKSIGSGAFGNVYLAKHKLNNKLYAIKHINKQNLIASEAPMQIIKNEISIQQSIHHKNIVPLYYSVEDKNNFYLVLEYLDHGSLFSLIRREKKLKEDEAFKYFIQISNAVYFLHSNNFVHRDLKPENILLDGEGNIKLCDFGWCVKLDEGGRKTFCGTYEYMAPEIINDEYYNKGIDVWSLGVLLYEMTHGYSPFQAREEQEIFENIVRRKFTIDDSLGLTEDCISMIKGLLDDEGKRMKIEDVFTHPWVKRYENKKKKEIIAKKKKKVSSPNVFPQVSPSNQKETIEKNTYNSQLNPQPSVAQTSDDMFYDVLDKAKKANEIKKGKKQKKGLEKSKTKVDLTKGQQSQTQAQKHNEVNYIKAQKKENYQIRYNNTKSALKERELESNEMDVTSASTKRESSQDKSKKEIQSTIMLLEKASQVKTELEPKKVSEPKEEESFWERMIKPFRCGK